MPFIAAPAARKKRTSKPHAFSLPFLRRDKRSAAMRQTLSAAWGIPLRPFGPAPLCGGEPRIGARRSSCLLRRGAEAYVQQTGRHSAEESQGVRAARQTNNPTAEYTPPSPAARKKRPSKPHNAAAIRSADKSPARLENGSGARADARPIKGRANLLTTQAGSRAPFSKRAIKGICPKRVRPHAFSLPFSRRKRKCGIVKGRIAP